MTRMDAELERVFARQAEKAAIERRLAAAQQEAARLEAKHQHTVRLMVAEEADVAQLESLSPTRIWIALKGERQDALERETAERDASRYCELEARAQLDVARRDVAALQAQLTEYAGLDQEYASALAAKEQRLRETSDPRTSRLMEIAEERGVLRSRDKELIEAHTAGTRAVDWLGVAEKQFGSARSWSTWDSFGGGGVFTDMVKYDHVDKANASLVQCNQALTVLARELKDVGITGVDGLQVEGLNRGLDVWFDNIFSDMSVRTRIIQAHDHVLEVRGWVADVVRRLAAEGHHVQGRLTDLDRERERLLTQS